jgi:hypothetical protein
VDGERADGTGAERLRALPRREVLGAVYPVAATRRARLLGLALLDRDDAEPGLFIPECRSIHTFGMRFPLDVWFLGPGGEPLAVRLRLGRARFAANRAASAVLEVPA